jgi:hypothetical protein
LLFWDLAESGEKEVPFPHVLEGWPPGLAGVLGDGSGEEMGVGRRWEWGGDGVGR